MEQSNLYAEQFFSKQSIIEPRSRLHSWKKKLLTVPEFLRFFALVIILGIARFPKMEDHWAKKWPFGSHIFRSIMPRDRFSMILKFFHLNDNSKYIRRGETGFDPLLKYDHCWTHCYETFKVVTLRIKKCLSMRLW